MNFNSTGEHNVEHYDTFLTGSNVILKSLSEEDVRSSGWYGWFNDPETTRYMQQGYFPNNIAKQLDYYRDHLLHAPNKIQLGILPTGAKQIVGVISLSNIDFINRMAEFGIVIGEKEYRAKGFGSEAARLMLAHGFGKLSLNKIWLGVHAGHKQAIRSYEKTGFKVEGILREEILLDGVFHDRVMMSILAREFLAIPQK